MWGEKPKKRETIFDEQHYTFLGKGVDFKGTAQFEGTVRVDGRFEGLMVVVDASSISKAVFIIGALLHIPGASLSPVARQSPPWDFLYTL